MVEYEECDGFGNTDNFKTNHREFDLKLNSNNEISIKPIKTSWSREEVTNILYKFRETYQYASNNIDVNKWISQNL